VWGGGGGGGGGGGFSKRARGPLLLLGVGYLIMWPTYWALRPANSPVSWSTRVRDSGLGYSSRAWNESPTGSYLREFDRCGTSDTWYSNRADGVYILTDRRTKFVPARMKGSPLSFPATEPWPKEKQATLIWFSNTDRPFLLGTEELLRWVDLVPMQRFQDATVYSMTRHQ